MEKGVGDKGDVGRRDVRQNAPVGLSREHSGSFSIIFFFFHSCSRTWPSLFPAAMLYGSRRRQNLPPPPCFPRPLSFRVSRLKRAKCFSQDQGRAQTPNGTGDPREWRPSQTNRIPVSIPLRCRRRLQREFPSAQPCRRRYCYPTCPSSSSPCHVSTLRNAS